jgi:NADPH-dependent glutamate synthase beta subunit-like oxidoreductase/NAD-dependent dihydropyrimidine dehydrogenase PreA subunit
MANGAKYRTLIPDIDFWQQMIPCQAACPIHTDAGKYVQLIAEQKDEQAYLTARSPNPFASVCGRVCAAPCEDHCRRGSIDAPVSIRALKRFVCEKYGVESLAPDTQEKLLESETEPGNKTYWHLPMLRESRRGAARGQKVAVIGSGPAGLACAHDLALMGYKVTVFEATAMPGGMMVHGIPEFRLARPVIDKEISRIAALGAELKLNAPLTESFGLKELREQGFEAVFLSVGTQRGRDLAIEGAGLDGVVKAIDFLLNVNHGYRVSLGRRVLVIGGGFVAFDAARMALRTALDAEQAASEGAMVGALDAARAAIRAGVADVRMISLESFAEMPVLRTAQGKDEFEEARREGIVFHPQRGTRRITGENGRVRAVELIGVRRTYDENGRFSPEYEPEISETLEADTVILAIGQRADLSFLMPEDGVELTPQGTIKVDPATLASTAPGVFAGGDVAFGPRNLIEAIANGKRAALSIDNHLRGVTGGPQVRLSIEKIPTRSYQRAAGYEKHARQAPPTIELNRRTGISEVETGYSDAEARRQAERCLYCHIQTIYHAERCVLCNRCVDICPEYCLKLVPIEDLDLDPLTAGRLAEHYSLSGGVLSAMIKDDEKCIRCGLCAIRCPTDAMTMEVFFYEEHEPAA